MSVQYQPLSPNKLADALVEAVVTRGWQVVGLDADPILGVSELARDLVDRLRTRSRPAVVVETAHWWRPASLRLELGLDPSAALSGWFDDNAIMRELLRPRKSGSPALTRLWDPQRDRSFRDSPTVLDPRTVVLLHGPFLQYLFLELDAVVRFSVSQRKLQRLLPPEQDWWVQAHRAYREACPDEGADGVVAWEHPATPALRWTS